MVIYLSEWQKYVISLVYGGPSPPIKKTNKNNKNKKKQNKEKKKLKKWKKYYSGKKPTKLSWPMSTKSD